jgi:uncharacterized protein YfaS (alpha-2-macroglobulin family)
MKYIPVRIYLFTLLFFAFSTHADAQFWKKKKKKPVTETTKAASADDSAITGLKYDKLIITYKKVNVKNSIDYKSSFAHIDSLMFQLDQPKSAREKVLAVKASAKADNQAGYFIKALRYEMNLVDRLEENPEIVMVKWQLLQTELNAAEEAVRVYLSLDMASFLKQLYESNRWNSNRIPDDSSRNPAEWSNARLQAEARRYIHQSLELARLYKVETYLEPIMDHVKGHDLALDVRQVVALQAIEVLKGMSVSTTIDYRSPEMADAMSPYAEFMKKDFKIADDPKNEYLILSLYQLVLSPAYHIYFDIERLRYAKEQYAGSGEFFLQACERIWARESGDTFSNLAAIEIAQYHRTDNPVKSLSIIEEAMKRHPGFSHNRRLVDLRSEIKRSVLSAEVEELNEPGKKMLAKVSYNNIGKVFIRAYRINYREYLQNSYGSYYNVGYRERMLKYISGQELIGSSSVLLPAYADYKLHSSEIALNELTEGMHLLVISNSENMDDSLSVVHYSTISVSKFAIVRETGRLKLLNAMTGMVEAGRSYKVYDAGNNWSDEKKYRLVESGSSGKDGSIGLPKSKDWSIRYVIEVEGNVIYEENFYREYEEGKQKDQVQVQLLTDRAIYRPGQKVYVKAIAYMGLAKKVASGQKLVLVLKDNNYEEKGRLTLKANAYGSASGTFILPKGGFNTGNFNISVLNTYGSANIKVEEYKRPKYTARIIEPETAFKLNDDVKISGEARALAGYALQGAKVSYVVKRKEKPKYWGYWYRGISAQSSEQTIRTGNLVTDENGRFTMEFKAVPDAKLDPQTNPYFIFEVAVTVTDLNGEVRTASYDMTMAYTDREITISGRPDYLDNEKAELNFTLKNLQQQPLPFTGKIVIKKVVRSGGVKRQRLWSRADTMNLTRFDFNMYESSNSKEETIVTGEKEFTGEKSGKWEVPSGFIKEQGEYIAIISTKDGRGETITSETRFNISPSQAGPYKQGTALKVLIVNGSAFEPGQTARVLIAGGVNNAVARVIVRSNRGLILEKEFKVAMNAQLIEIPIKPEDRGDIVVYASMIYDYRSYIVESWVTVPYTNKQLQIKLSSFRSDLEPGSREKWVMTLKGPASEKAAMEAVAVMYDQSLDELYKNPGWDFGSELYQDFSFYTVIENNMGIRMLTALKTVDPPYTAYGQIKYPRFNNVYLWNLENARPTSRFMEMNGVSGRGSRANGNANVKGGGRKDKSSGDDKTAYDGEVNQEVGYATAETPDQKKEDAEKPQEGEEPPTGGNATAIRKNFNETAFFFPELYANEQGEITIEFTMPEALTKWKMMMFAHSKTMQTGYAEESVTTSKKVMLQPNMPRFLRQGDKISIAAKVINTTEEAMSAKVIIKITDEETGKVLNWLSSENNKMLNVPAGGNASCDFMLDIPDYTGVVSVAIYAIAGNYSDGEQNTLLVLSRRSLVTETMPITIRKAGAQKLEFTNLKNNNSKTLAHEKLSVEMSSNPAWYAVQALPYMMEYPHECAEQVFTRLYANSIAVFIANSDPAIKKVYEAWEREAANGTGLQSKLMMNQDLRSSLIEETPWLKDARNETGRMRQLGILFNRKRMNEEIGDAWNKLKQAQMSDGAWPWFKGMDANPYITQTIVIGFGKMKRMGIDVSPYQSMIDQAIRFLDNIAKRDYEYYMSLKEKKNFYPANLQYIYCKSYFPTLGFGDTSRVLKYFMTNAEETWQQNSLMNRAQLATALAVLKPLSQVPKLILRSFEENSKQTDEMGMYWPANTGGWYWHQAPVETQAAIIEAYSRLGSDKNLIREQQIWLLRQKQTQSWKTTRSTADACYALLMNGNLLGSKQNVTVSVNNSAITPAKKEEGTGYFRQDIPKENISQASGDISINASTSDFAYGAVYWQYFEDMDKIKSAGAGLSIVKRLYKVVNTASGVQKVEVKSGDMLQIGDIIEVSLSIGSDRNLEFVHIRDQRASGTEPSDVLSEYHWQNGLGYYQSTRDASTNFFIDNMPKGNYQMNYTLKVEQAGVFNSGMATAQCMYAPEYAVNSQALILKVE